MCNYFEKSHLALYIKMTLHYMYISWHKFKFNQISTRYLCIPPPPRATLQMNAGIYGECAFHTCKNDRETLYRGKPQ